ncbi:MAG: maleylacetoacetate isomerase [Nevskia sp.]|nr:maleylacetoacetate isomerase [Nevskia sp.]
MLQLYSYWRSSCSWRVRCALNLKGMDYEIVPVHLLRDGGEQHRPGYRALNPQGLVPLLVDGGFRLGQSLAILQYLEARNPAPALVPTDPQEAARMWALCQAIACEIQPLQNTRVLQYLAGELGLDEPRRSAWLRHWIAAGLNAVEESLRSRPQTMFSFGDSPSLADCCLVPQLASADRFGAQGDWPRLRAVALRCAALPAFAAAHPERQPDAGKP